ncbi:MAG TPA: ATP synthase F0 subunit B [Verrucomicrobiae bacterium]|jgi:F-type H+-transporting ATPase subunit b|nr:ATP synthase F0 subunit B [Verrucomicrobiae bacterium]
MSLRHRFCSAILLCGVLAGPGLAHLYGQERPAQESKTGSTANAPETPGKEPAGYGNDEDQALRHSPVVEFIARKTGLSLNVAYWLVVMFNFAIVIGILWRVLSSILPGMFKGRSESLQKRMEEARQATHDARVRLADVESRLAGLDVEIARMRREAEESARAEEQRIRNSSEEERRRIVQSAEQEIAQAASAARRELKAYVAELAVDLAEKKINVTPSVDQTLLREFTAQIGKDGN